METSDTPQPVNNPKPTIGNRRNWIIGALILAVIIFQYFSWRSSHQQPAEPKVEAKQPLFHRDEPVKPQIFQDDYKAKVREMLDSGKSVMQISKETGIRIDVVRKIKKQKSEEE